MLNEIGLLYDTFFPFSDCISKSFIFCSESVQSALLKTSFIMSAALQTCGDVKKNVCF